VNPARLAIAPSRAEIVHRAVALISPDERRRTECVNRVKLALSMIGRQDKIWQRYARLRSKPTQRAADRFLKVLKDLQRASRDPDLSDELWAILPDGEPERLIERFNAAQEAARKETRKRFYYKAHKRLAAATEAHHLLRQFNRKIIAEKESVFLRLAALLCGEPPSSLNWACRRVISRAKSTAVLSPKNR
jgi:hypothetical protein